MRVVVVGAGLAGLFIGSELVASGLDEVVVVDASDRAGGIARTIHGDGYSLEPAVGSFNLPHPHLSPILERSGVGVMEAVGPAHRHIYRNGRLLGLSSSPRALLEPLVPLSAKIRALAEPVIPGRDITDESLAAFCHRRFGARAGGLLAWLMAAGVFAGDPERLSLSAGFPSLARLERENGSILRGALRSKRRRSAGPRPRPHVPTGGVSSMADAVAASLGARFRAGFAVESITHEDGIWAVEGAERLEADAVVLAVRPGVAMSLVDDSLAHHLSSAAAAAAPVVVVGLGGEGPSPAPAGFGALVGPDEEMATLGVTFESSYAPDRAPDGAWLVKVIAGGATNREVAQWDGDRVVSKIIDELSRIIAADVSPTHIEIVRHLPGIPQYEIGHVGWLAGLDERLRERPGLRMAGWGYRNVGLSGLASEAAGLARDIIG